MAGSPPPERQRSRSPRRSAPKSSGGFKWKEKRPANTSYDDNNDRDRRGLDRGYRNRSPRRDNRDRDHDRDRDRDRPRDSDRDRDRDRDRPRPRTDDRYQPSTSRTKDAKDTKDSRDSRDDPSSRRPPPKPAPTKKPSAPTGGGGGGEEMIIVTVNDRLGTKAQIPCFASDRIADFRVLVAARIGRKPHEILLKRQGQRPFKDQLSLADYEVHNGAQIDLEVDTGD